MNGQQKAKEQASWWRLQKNWWTIYSVLLTGAVANAFLRDGSWLIVVLLCLVSIPLAAGSTVALLAKVVNRVWMALGSRAGGSKKSEVTE
jgi:hypothetical protein